MTTIRTRPKTRPDDIFSCAHGYLIPSNVDCVRVLHPFLAHELPLLKLPALDVSKDDTTVGVQHRLVLDACWIITNHQSGFLSGSRVRSEEEQRLDPNLEIVSPGRYFYHLQVDSLEPYQVVTKFNA